MEDGYRKVKSIKHSVVNTVKESRFNQLIKSGEYEEYDDTIKDTKESDTVKKQDSEVCEEIVKTVKRKRRTKAEIEADNGK
jgi:phage pi2 protein 07